MEYFNHLDNSYEISRFKLAESRAVTKSRKTLKNDKSKEKMGILRKSQENSENLTKFEKMSDYVLSNLQNSLFSKAIKWL